jgi:DNA-binding response OmpR family regulator
MKPRGNASARPLRILIADDDRDAAFSLMMLLRDAGHDVHAVYAGRYVMGGVIDVDPDVVLLDVNLPDMSGWDVALTIRRQRGNQRPRLIGVGGDGTQAPDKTLAGIFGFDHYLRKPYDPQALIALLAQVRKQPKQPKQPTKAG